MSRRDQIRMTEQEIAQFLAQGRTLAVATIGVDGAPHLVAMWYTLIDGKIAFWTYAKSMQTKGHSDKKFYDLRTADLR